MTVHQFDRTRALQDLVITITTGEPTTTLTYTHLGFAEDNQASRVYLVIDRPDGFMMALPEFEIPVNAAGRFDLRRLLRETKLVVGSPQYRGKLSSPVVDAIRRVPLAPIGQLNISKPINDADGNLVATIAFDVVETHRNFDGLQGALHNAQGDFVELIGTSAERDALDAISVENLLSRAGYQVFWTAQQFNQRPIASFVANHGEAIYNALTSPFGSRFEAAMVADRARPKASYELDPGLVGLEISIAFKGVGRVWATHLGYDPTRKGDRFKIFSALENGDPTMAGLVDVERIGDEPLSTARLCFEIEELARVDTVFPPRLATAIADNLQNHHITNTGFVKLLVGREGERIGSVAVIRRPEINTEPSLPDTLTFAYADNNGVLGGYNVTLPRTANNGFNVEALLHEMQDCIGSIADGRPDTRATAMLIEFVEANKLGLSRSLQPEPLHVVTDLPTIFM